MRINRKAMICMMLEKNMNINELAQKSNVSRGTISSIKSGKSCTDTTVGKIAKALNVPVEKLIDMETS
jgi:putative transcriptional regulator